MTDRIRTIKARPLFAAQVKGADSHFVPDTTGAGSKMGLSRFGVALTMVEQYASQGARSMRNALQDQIWSWRINEETPTTFRATMLGPTLEIQDFHDVMQKVKARGLSARGNRRCPVGTTIQVWGNKR